MSGEEYLEWKKAADARAEARRNMSPERREKEIQEQREQREKKLRELDEPDVI